MSSLRTLLVLVLVIGLIITFGCTTSPQQQAARQPPTAAASGAAMYDSYCSDCHAADGKGSPLAAALLKVTPPDLTTLAKRNGGIYPAGNIYQAIKWGGGIYRPRSHKMPVWGAELKKVSGNDDAALSARIMELTNHVASLQVR